MKRTIGEIIKCFLIGGLLLCIQPIQAQVTIYPEVYPDLPFDLKKVSELGNNKCSIWKGTYKRGAEDRSGEMWAEAVEYSHQYQRYEFVDGKMGMISTYLPSGFKKWSIEYFYKQNLISAVEKLNYDSLQNTSLDYTYVYIYEHNGTPFQRVKMHGAPNKSVRLLDEFEFDSLNRVVRQKTTAVGTSPYMDSLVGLLDKEKLLTVTEYTDSTNSCRVYKNLYEITKDRKTFLDEEGQPVITQVRNSSGKILFTIDYKYENNRISKKIHWVMREPTMSSRVSEEPETVVKKKKKKKKEQGQLATSPRDLNNSPTDLDKTKERVPSLPPRPEIYKLEYFTYNNDGLLEMHITEEDGIQTILEYTYFSE